MDISIFAEYVIFLNVLHQNIEQLFCLLIPSALDLHRE